MLGGKYDNLGEIRDSIEEFCQNLDVERKDILEQIGGYTDQFRKDIFEKSKKEVSPLEHDYREKRKIIQDLGQKVNNKEIDNVCLELEKLEKDKLIKELYSVIKQHQNNETTTSSPIEHLQTLVSNKHDENSHKK